VQGGADFGDEGTVAFGVCVSGLFAAVLRARSAVDFAAGLLEPDWHADFR